MAEQRWVRITGDGLAWTGPCLVTHIIFWPHGGEDHVDVYDGRDTTSGKMFVRLETYRQTTRHVALGRGVPFDVGIYVHAGHRQDQTTVVFVPV